MQRLPDSDERQWLTHALKKVIARRRTDILDSAPLVEPTNRWFPEPWLPTTAHGHRLSQRLMHYAGLGNLKVSLSAFEAEWLPGEDEPWDANTAGWFAGIRDGRVSFGLHVDQFSDPEAAAGVMAHEVAHAWRSHHHLIVDDRGKEELLTDVTTIVLGFGILSTNNTDRYRTWGSASESGWKNSAVGYLPPYAMAYLLALWSHARARPAEQRAIEKHLEPNQLGCYRDALEALAQDGMQVRSLLGVSSRPIELPGYEPGRFTPAEPLPDELDEPEWVEEEAINDGRQVFRLPRGDYLLHAVFGAIPAFIMTWLISSSVLSDIRALAIASASAIAASAFMIRRAAAAVCSECRSPVATASPICAGCGGTLGNRVTQRELRRRREEELDRLAIEEIPFEECSSCAPEEPCAIHS